MNFPFKIVIFHGYVELPEGSPHGKMLGPIGLNPTGMGPLAALEPTEGQNQEPQDRTMFGASEKQVDIV